MEILFIFYKPLRCGRLSLVICIEIQSPSKAGPVSYTHLDVYKRQALNFATSALASLTRCTFEDSASCRILSVCAVASGSFSLRYLFALLIAVSLPCLAVSTALNLSLIHIFFRIYRKIVFLCLPFCWKKITEN